MSGSDDVLGCDICERGASDVRAPCVWILLNFDGIPFVLRFKLVIELYFVAV